MKTAIASSILVVLFLASAAARGDGECDKYTTSYDHTYCFSKLFVESDKELNDVHEELRNVVEAAAKQHLTETQRA